MSKFSVELKRLRKERKMSQADLAKALNISRSAIGMYEQGQREPNFETLEAIADYFNVDMAIFLNGQSDCDLYYQCNQKEPYDVVQLFMKLDAEDRSFVVSMIQNLLLKEKYKEKKEIALHA